MINKFLILFRITAFLSLFYVIFKSTLLVAAPNPDQKNAIRVNQLGYFPNATKTATLLVDVPIGKEIGNSGTGPVPEAIDSTEYRNYWENGYLYDWRVINTDTGEIVFSRGYRSPFQMRWDVNDLQPNFAGRSKSNLNGGTAPSLKQIKKVFTNPTGKYMYQIDFSYITQEGRYYVALFRKPEPKEDTPDNGNTGEEAIYYSITFEINSNKMKSQYQDMANMAYLYYYFHRLGSSPELAINGVDGNFLAAYGAADASYSREALHGNPVPCSIDNTVPDWCNGETLGGGMGWADAGDFGQYPVNHAFAAWQLLNSLEFAPAGSTIVSVDPVIPASMQVVDPTTQTRVPVLEEVILGSDYFKNLLPNDPNLLAPHKIHNSNWGDFSFHAWDTEKEKELSLDRVAIVPSTASTLAICRTGMHISRLLAKYGENDRALDWYNIAYSARKRAYAIQPYKYYASNYSENDIYDGGGPYSDDDISDDFYACDVESYISTYQFHSIYNIPLPESPFLPDLLNKIREDEHFGAFPVYGKYFDWKHVAATANFSLLTTEHGGVPANSEISPSLKSTAEIKLEMLEPYSGKISDGTTITAAPKLPTTVATYWSGGEAGELTWLRDWEWGSNALLVNDLQLLAYAAKFADPTNTVLSQRFAAASLHGMDYILGENAQNLSFVTGFGPYAEEDTHDRFAWNIHKGQDNVSGPPELFPDQVLDDIAYPRGWLAGGPQNEWTSCVVKEKGFVRPYEKGTPFWIIPGEPGFLSTDSVWQEGEQDQLEGIELDGNDGYHFGIKSTENDTSARDTLGVNLIMNMFLADEFKIAIEEYVYNPSGERLERNYSTYGSPPVTEYENFPAETYGGIGWSPEAWCSKENTINWNSGLVWMSSMASGYLAQQLESVVPGECSALPSNSCSADIPVEMFPSDSGIEDQSGSNIESAIAQVFLVEEEASGNIIYTLVPFSDDILDTSGELDLPDGTYVVRVTSIGCFAPDGSGLDYVQSDPINHPEEDLSFNLEMSCPQPGEGQNGEGGGEGNANVDFEVQIKDQWDGGYCKNIKVQNTDSAALNWFLTIEEPNEIYVGWNLNMEKVDDSTYLVTGAPSNNAWCSQANTADCAGNFQQLNAGETLDGVIGYCATSSDAPPPTPPISATTHVTNSWPGGYCAEVKVTNNGSSAVDSWRTEFTTPGWINQFWNVNFSQTGARIVISNVGWNGHLAPGQSTHSIGFCANL